MPIITSQPTSDKQTEWPFLTPSSPTTHYTKVDEGVPFNTSDFVEARGVLKTDRYGYPSDSPADMGTVTDIVIAVHINGAAADKTPGVEVTLMDSAGAVTYAGPLGLEVGTTGWETKVFSFTGLALTKAQYDDMSVRYKTVDGGTLPPAPNG